MKDKELEKVGKEVAKKKRTRPDRADATAIHTNPGENTKYLSHNLQIAQLPAIDIADENQVASRILQYFQICETNDMKPSMAGLALAIGVSRQTLWNWSTGETRGSEHLNLIKKAVQMLDAQMVDYMQNGKINPVAGIFLMKNGFGYKDQQEVLVKPEAPLGEKRDVDALREQYIESIPEELPPEGSI